MVNGIMNNGIKRTRVSVESGKVQAVLESCKELLNIRRHIPIIYQKHIKTPAICGVFGAKLLMPADILDRLDTEEIRYVILHELCHFKRKDTVMGVFQILLCILHWFNPLVWYGFYKMKEDREAVCDEQVLSCIKPCERRNYAETLIKVLQSFSQNHRLYSMSNMSQGSVSSVEWRLRLMNILKKPPVVLGAAVALITVTLGVSGVLYINKHLSFEIPAGMKDKNPAAAVRNELPARGKILDRNGRELAVNIRTDVIALSPKEIKASAMDTDSIAQTLADSLMLEKERVLEKVTADSQYEIIKRNVDKETGNMIKKWAADNKIHGMIFYEDFKRYYPNGSLAAHVIGFTGASGNDGLTGIEASMEQYLKIKGAGAEGKQTLQSGDDVVLTIDTEIQRMAEEALDRAMQDDGTGKGGAVIIMDPGSGEILAMASRPDFNPNPLCPAGIHFLSSDL